MQANKSTFKQPNYVIHIQTIKQKVTNIDQWVQPESSHQSISTSQKVTCY